MSKLLSWIQDSKRAVSRLNKAITNHNDDPTSALPQVPFPLPGTMEAQNILNYRKQQRNRLRGHSLATHRRCFLLDFHNNVHQACLMVNEQKPSGTIADLWQPLKRIRAALKDLRLVEANDDTRPVADRELPRKLLMEKTDCNPRQIWLQIKLGYTKICLEILVQILKYIYPERIDYWIDAEEDLRRPQWQTQFSLDTQESLESQSHPCSDIWPLATNEKSLLWHENLPQPIRNCYDRSLPLYIPAHSSQSPLSPSFGTASSGSFKNYH